jgi:Spy/CpxP family protein refolding chaperone
MNLKKNWKVVLYLAAIFIAGGITGSFVTLQTLKHMIHKHRNPENLCAMVMKRLESELKLTPEQVQKIKPIVDQSVRELEAIRSKTISQSSQVISRSEEQIAQELTPEQQKRFQKIQQERHKHFKERFGPKSD